MIKLVSVNIESDKHLELVEPFLARESAEVVCLMEVLESRIEKILPDYGYREFLPNRRMEDGSQFGVAIVSKLPLRLIEKFYGDGNSSDELSSTGRAMDYHRPVLLVGEVRVSAEWYRVGVVHYTWTRGGLVNDEQIESVGRLMERVGDNEMVLVGDFNMPRNLPGGSEVYETVAARMKDNIPPSIESTIDPDLHRANIEERGRLKLMVDYVWSTKKYDVANLRVVSGVSDHCALVCSIKSLA